jgi:hypothetical protein
MDSGPLKSFYAPEGRGGFHLIAFVLRRLFFAAQQRIAITLSPEYYQKMQRSTTRKNQEEHGPEVKYVWRNYQKTIAVEKMSQTKPQASVPLPHLPSQMASIFRGVSTWQSRTRRIHPQLRPAILDGNF